MFNKNKGRYNRSVKTNSSAHRSFTYSGVSRRAEQNGSPRSIKLKIKNLGRWLTLFAILGVILYFISASSRPIIRINDNEKPVDNITSYSASAETIIKSKFTNKTKITFDYLEFEKTMKDKHPEIKSISTSFAIFGGRPVVRLSFYEPALLVTSLGKTWVVDARGVAIDEYSSSVSSLPKVIDEIGVPIEIGGTIISSQDVAFISKIEKIAKEKGIVVEKYTTPNLPKQIDVKVAGEGYYTKFNLNEDPAVQIGTWLVARDNLIKNNQVPAEYMDIRALEKVYWK